jgi:hypothetical protein
MQTTRRDGMGDVMSWGLMRNGGLRRRERRRWRQSRPLVAERLEGRELLYAAPVGGWDYVYEGAQADEGEAFSALDGTWDHDNGSDSWDGTASGGAGAPGGAGIFTEGTTNFLRIEDTGDPRGQGFADPSNRKIFFGHNLATEGTTGNVLSSGITLHFRTRLATTGPLDHSVPAGGDGYRLNNSGKANFMVSSGGATIGFVLGVPGDGSSGSPALVVNGLGTPDTSTNQFNVTSWADWHDFWITIQPGGAGTHQVTIFADDSTSPQVFDVTAGTGVDYSGMSYLAMGAGATDQSGAFDVDYFGYKSGVFLPIAADPPVVENSAATGVGSTSAVVGGVVTATGGESPQVTIYWGDNDGGTDPGSWDGTLDLGTQSGSFNAPLTGLSPSRTYYFRAYAENSGGADWADASESFTTSAVALPTVINTPATGITGYSALLGGNVLNTGGDPPAVTVYYGDNDGGSNAGAWDHSVQVGAQAGLFSAAVTNLQPATRYFFRSFATNVAGSKWALFSSNFTTLAVSAPAITTLPPVTVGPFSARVAGEVTDIGNAPTNVTLYWGDNDGVTNAAAWDHAVDLGQQDGSFVELISGLTTGDTYYYRVYAENIAGSAWGATTQSFTTRETPPVVISEFIASNRNTLTTRVRASDDVAYVGLAESPDWIEVLNPGADSIDLSGYYLTDSLGNLQKWQIPAGTVLGAGEFLVVFASGKNIVNTNLDESGRYHTNFTLDGSGENLAIVNAAGEILHAYQPYPNQRSNVSYGMDGAGFEGYYLTATPGAPNSTAVHFVADTKFSIDRGYFSVPFDTVITTSTPGATIIYTTDGSIPSLTNGTQVLPPDTDTPPMATVHIATTTNLRAAAFRSDLVASTPDTQTYIFAADVLRQSAADVPPSSTWGHAGPDWAMDPEVVNLSENDPNRLRESDLQAIPTISLSMNWNDMFGAQGIYRAGEGIPKATSFEFIDPATGESVQANASIEIQGGSSTERWKTDKISMRVRFTEEYGPTKLDFPIFTDESATTRFDTLNIDAQLNYVWSYGPNNTQRSQALYVHDQYVSDLHNALTGEVSSYHGRFAHLYINGIYWGMHFLHERPDESFAAEYYGGEKEEYHAINQNRSINDGINPDGTPTPVNTAVNDLNAMVAKAQAAGTGGLAEWEALKQVLDVDNFIDYLLVNWYTGNGDWGDTKNWYASRHNTPDGKWRFHNWDAEKALENFATGGRNDVGLGPKGLHTALRNSAHYRLLFADHIQRAMFNGGVLTEAVTVPLFQRRADEIESAIRAESARWGDNRETNEYLRQHLMNNFTSVLNNFFPGRTDRVLTQLRSANLYPAITAPIFDINGTAQHGGEVTVGDALTIRSTQPASAIYYTLDGSDPRHPDGSIAGTEYDQTVSLSQSMTVRARAFSAGQWSAIVEADFVVLPPAGGIVISEINYNPSSPTDEELASRSDLVRDDFEFLELLNTSDVESFNLLGMALNAGVELTFGNQSLAPGERAVVVEDLQAFRLRYGDSIRVLGEWSGGLSDNGERITLADPLANPLVSISYADSGDWPERPDGAGATLELIDEATTELYDKPYQWRASTEWGGTPGTAGAGPVGIVINEVLADNDSVPPRSSDAIELFNATASSVDLSGWYLSDSQEQFAKFQIPAGTILSPGGYVVFNESDFNPTPETPATTHFALSASSGDDVWLTQLAPSGQVARFIDDVHFAASDFGESFGRVAGASGLFVPQIFATLGCQNTVPRVGPLVISELAYNPGEPSPSALAVYPALTEDDLEFVEITNPTQDDVSLTNWRLRGGVDYDFAESQGLGAGDSLLVISFNPSNPANQDRVAAFRAHYGLDASVVLVGGYAGQLSDSGETVRLERPGTPPASDPEATPHLLEDIVRYDDRGVWPQSADGSGDSLQRRSAVFFGGLVSSWSATLPTPGVAVGVNVTPGDLTGDGVVNAMDIDVLYHAVRSGRSVDAYDLDHNAVVDHADVAYLLTSVLGTRAGDVNLDGVVDARDFNVWNQHKFTDCGVGYGQGDSNGDGAVDAADFNLWLANRFLPVAAQPASAGRTPRAAASGGQLTSTRVVDAALATLGTATERVHVTGRIVGAAIQRRQAAAQASGLRRDVERGWWDTASAGDQAVDEVLGVLSEQRQR